MRKKMFLGAFIAVSMTLMSSTCSNDDDENNGNSNVDLQELTVISTTGTWHISNFVDDGQDETYHFTNYSFTFSPDGNVVAENGSTSITGMWSIGDDNSSDDDSSSDVDFNLFFNVSESSEFEDLNDDWDIVNYSESTITLTDVSGGDGSVDNLVFTKN